MRYLTFTLAAPIAAYGAIAVAAQRPSSDRPAKSAIIGLIAAALGIERSDEATLQWLNQTYAYGLCSRKFTSGAKAKTLTDYQTTQSVKADSRVTFHSRRGEIANADKQVMILSLREYRSNSLFEIALWPAETTSGDLPGPAITLEQIAAALQEPVFVPYAGRKNCPLMLPFAPLIIEAEDIRMAFVERDEQQTGSKALLEAYGLASEPDYLAYDSSGMPLQTGAPNVAGRRQDMRRDSILNRQAWQFGPRSETVEPWVCVDI